MDLDADMIPTSPSADSSPSSSDLDTESTGSFFPDRSTTLGTLMGVSAFGERRAARAPAVAGEDTAEGAQRASPDREEARRGVGVWRRRRRRRRRHGRGSSSLGGSWWRLCRDHGDGGGPPTSLGEILDMERQLAGANFLCDDGGTGASGRETAVAATALFEDGRVRPPQQPAAEERGRWRLLRASEGSSSTTTSSLARLPVLLTGICSGGAGYSAALLATIPLATCNGQSCAVRIHISCWYTVSIPGPVPSVLEAFLSRHCGTIRRHSHGS
ncbi:uncharacterized protein At3g17950-like [Miscanthus floridulus]|uniref:uncharacterized protein At3g17950-like n=1 Tax=Miscanthus floridulus TaxID=154761 RepID=UPI0034584599